MTAETAYQFIQGPLDQMDAKERKKLCRLISGEPEQPKPKKRDTIPTVEWYKKQLLKSVFKR